MKTTKLLQTLALFFGLTASVNAQDYIYTIIDVYGTRYSDQMMLFSIPGCTHGFDNGWDANKMFGNYLTPQIFNIEADGYYQINSVDDVNNTEIGFKSGEDSVYTMVFTNVLTETKYQQLYLIDLVSNKNIDITANGTSYTFTCPRFSEIVKRFKIVTTNPNIVVPPVADNSTTVTTPSVDSTVVVPPTTTTDKGAKNKNKDKKLKMSNCKNVIAIENQSKEKAEMKIVDSTTGKCVSSQAVAALTKVSVNPNVKRGAYIVTLATSTEKTSMSIIVQ